MQNLKHTLTAISAQAAPIPPHRFVYLDGTGDLSVKLAADATHHPVLGVSVLGCTTENDAFSVDVSGPSLYVELGATLAAGNFINAGAEGKAVAAGEGEYSLGFLLEGGVSGSIVRYIRDTRPPMAAAEFPMTENEFEIS